MNERPYVRNELSGDARGHVVQAGAIHGDLIFHPSIEPRNRESEETDLRWGARRRRILDAEDAQKAASQGRADQYVRVCRSKRRINAVLLAIEGVAVVLGVLHVLSAGFVIFGPLFMIVTAYGWVRYTLIIRSWDAGRTIKVPTSRLRW